MGPRLGSCHLPLLAALGLLGPGAARADGPAPSLRIETGMHTAAVSALAVDGGAGPYADLPASQAPDSVIKDLVAGFAIALPAPALSLNDADEGRLYVAGLGDGTVRWYRAAERREAFGLFVHPDQRRWVLFTP